MGRCYRQEGEAHRLRALSSGKHSQAPWGVVGGRLCRTGTRYRNKSSPALTSESLRLQLWVRISELGLKRKKKKTLPKDSNIQIEPA